MSDHITSLPLPFVTNVIVDARAVDVSIQVDPTMIFAHGITPGEGISPEDFETGISLNIQKGNAVSITALLENDKAVELVEALITCIVRGDPDPNKVERAEALLERLLKAMTEGLETPARLPGQQFGCIHVESDSEVSSEEVNSKDEEGDSGCTN